MASSSACIFTFFCQKKCQNKSRLNKNKQREKKKKARNKARKQEWVTSGWTDISSPGPASFLIYKFRVLQYAHLRNSIKLLNVRGTNKQFSFNTEIYCWIFYNSHDVMCKRPVTSANCQNKQFLPKLICFSFRLSKVNKEVIIVTKAYNMRNFVPLYIT